MKLENIKPERVFYYFGNICDVPHGSGDTAGMRRYLKNFAMNHGLEYETDDADNVIIYKSATEGYENSEPVILQGHTDMVCQKTDDYDINFVERGIESYIDGDFVKAKGTTLGADNGIAVAMILAVLEDDTIPHPPIEAVFTSDEEIGMLGASALDKSLLKGKRMINLDSEDGDVITVSCAGGSDVTAVIPTDRITVKGDALKIVLKGLNGGHSGIEINGNRVNADILMGRVLNHLRNETDFSVVSIFGGDKSNAIPNYCEAELVAYDGDALKLLADEYLETIKAEISDREGNFSYSVEIGAKDEYKSFAHKVSDKLINILVAVPNGVMDMSASVEGLVETSLNLGILATDDDAVNIHISLRSNKASALKALEERVVAFFRMLDVEADVFGKYLPWEYNENSVLRETYKRIYKEQMGEEPEVEAIHAGLECGVFAAEIEDFDCISIGPFLYDVHTVNERLSISSTETVYKNLLKLLEELR